MPPRAPDRGARRKARRAPHGRGAARPARGAARRGRGRGEPSAGWPGTTLPFFAAGLSGRAPPGPPPPPRGPRRLRACRGRSAPPEARRPRPAAVPRPRARAPRCRPASGGGATSPAGSGRRLLARHHARRGRGRHQPRRFGPAPAAAAGASSGSPAIPVPHQPSCTRFSPSPAARPCEPGPAEARARGIFFPPQSRALAALPAADGPPARLWPDPAPLPEKRRRPPPSAPV